MEIIYKNITSNNYQLTLTLNSNEVIGITGKNCSKILSILGLQEEQEGIIYYDSIKIDKSNRSDFYKKISYIKETLEKPTIINTVREYMEFMISYYRLQIKDINKKLKDSLKIVGLEESFLERLLTTLSKSETKLIQIAMSLLSNPEVLILEEPFLDLDNKNEKKIYMLLLRLKEQYKKLIIISSSNSNILHKYTTKMFFIKNDTIFLEGKTQEVYQRVDFLKRNGFSIPEIIQITYKANKKKEAGIEFHKDIRDLIKDIYKHV